MTQQTMKGYIFSKSAKPTLAFKEDLPVPKPRAGTVLVKISALWVFRGMDNLENRPFTFPKKPFIPGGDAVGTIEEVGSDVFNLKKGQRVIVARHVITSENVSEPSQALVGMTSFHAASGGLDVLEAYPDGTFAEYCLVPKDLLTPVPDDIKIDDAHLSLLGRFAIVYGGLLKGRLVAGETVIIIGATGQFGSSAVALALAMGAGKVVAAGRNEEALKSLVGWGDKRLTTVKLTGEVEADTAALRAASGGGAHVVFDMVGQAKDSNAQTSGLKSLLRGGRMVLQGSLLVPWAISYFDIVLNDLEIIGKYMHEPKAFMGLLNLVQSGLLDLNKFKATTFPFNDVQNAFAAARQVPLEESVFLVL